MRMSFFFHCSYKETYDRLLVDAVLILLAQPLRPALGAHSRVHERFVANIDDGPILVADIRELGSLLRNLLLLLEKHSLRQ